MNITDMKAYKKLEANFKKKGYSLGIKDTMPIYCWNNDISANSTPGHYVGGIEYSMIKFEQVPEKFRTREFFLHVLSGVYHDIVEFVKTHPSQFDKQFFKDHIATNYYGLEFELNDFEYMPLEYIDEEMVACAMFRSINMRYVDRRGDCEAWFYSVYRRKPEVLTKELYTIGARLFAEKRNGKNKFLEITPEKYRTKDYYFAMCLMNNTPVMEDIPEDVLTTNFLVTLINDSPQNIQCFNESAMEKIAPMDKRGTVKLWQAAIINDGYQIRNIPLNDERVEFFLSNYAKNSPEYEYGFKEHYKQYLRKKNSIPEPKDNTAEMAGLAALVTAMTGISNSSAIDFGNKFIRKGLKNVLPIRNYNEVPVEYCKQFDREEYLVEIYKKLGITVKEEADWYYYDVDLPKNLSIVSDDYGYWVKDNSSGEPLIHYYDRGPFYDRSVYVDKINIFL